MKKFIIMAVSLLLTALLALAGCMYAIGENKAESKPYDMGETVSVVPEDTPEAQKAMEKKFSVYNHVTEENGKKILTLFSEEQAEEQWMKRRSGEEFRLTYDEILFLIGDSARLYETYDEIVLPNVPFEHIVSSGFGGGLLAGLAKTIQPSPKEAAALTFRGETEHFALRMREITDIIVYRLFMLDSGLRPVQEQGLASNREEEMQYVPKITVEGVSYYDFLAAVTDESIRAGHLLVDYIYDTLPAYTYSNYWALLLDDGRNGGEDAYRQALVKHLLCGEVSANVFADFEAEYTVLTFGGLVEQIAPDTFQRTCLLPTAEMEETAPVWELKASYLTAYQSSGLSSIASAPDIWFFSGEEETYCTRLYGDTCWKYLGDPEAVVNAIAGGKPVGILGEGEAFYRVDLDNGTAILLPATEEYDGDTLAAAQIVAADGGVPGELYLCVSKEFADLIRRIAKPYVEYYLPDTKPAE